MQKQHKWRSYKRKGNFVPYMRKATKGERDYFLRVGAEIEDPSKILCWRETFCKATYNKYYVNTKGKESCTTAPIMMVLGDGWRFWQLAKGTFIAYHPEATIANKWWESIRQTTASATPEMKGDLVVFAWEQDMGKTWDQLVLHIKVLLYEKHVRKLVFSPAKQ